MSGDTGTASLITIVPLDPAQGEYDVRQVITPVATNITKTESQVMEILRVRWIFDIISGGAASSKVIGFLNIDTIREAGPGASNAAFINDMEDTGNFALATLGTEFTTSGSRTYKPEVVVDMTDGSGNGVVIAARTLDVICGRQVGTVTDASRCEIYFRIKRIKNSAFTAILSQQLAGV